MQYLVHTENFPASTDDTLSPASLLSDQLHSVIFVSLILFRSVEMSCPATILAYAGLLNQLPVHSSVYEMLHAISIVTNSIERTIALVACIWIGATLVSGLVLRLRLWFIQSRAPSSADLLAKVRIFSLLFILYAPFNHLSKANLR